MSEAVDNSSASAANARILSRLGVPAYLQEESAQIRAETQRLCALRDSLEQCDSVSATMVTELDAFDLRMRSLERTLQPIDADTRSFVTAGQRLDAVLTEVTQIIDNYSIAHEPASKVNERRIETDCNGYLEWVAALHVAVTFWSRNSSFKNADSTLRRLRELLRQAISACEAEFARLLSTHTRIPDLSRLPWPLPASFELIPASIVSRLASIAQSLDSSGNYSYLDSLSSIRGSFCKTVLRRAPSSGYNPYALRVALESRAGIAAAAAAATATGVAPATAAASASAAGTTLVTASTGAGAGAGMGGVDMSYLGGSLNGSGVGSLVIAASVVRESQVRRASILHTTMGSVAPSGARGEGRRSSVHGSTGAAAAGGGSTAAAAAASDAASAAAAMATAADAAAGALAAAAGGRDRLGRYARGTHRSVFIVDLSLKLAELESELWYRVVQATALEAEDLDDRLASALAEMLDSLTKQVDGCIKERSPNRLLHLLDLLSHLTTALPRFRAALKKGLRVDDQFGKITELRRQVSDAVCAAVADQRAAIDLYRPESGALARSGNTGAVSALSVDVMALLQQLAAFVDAISTLTDTALRAAGALPPAGPTAGADEDMPLLQRLMRLFLEALEKNLEKQAANMSREPALAQLFLLNNYHYVLRAASRLSLPLGRSWEARYQSKVRAAQAAYSTATWTKLLGYISLGDAPSILAQCKGAVVPDSVKPSIKRKFAGFNNAFNDIYRTQRTYSIPDADLRGQVRASNMDLVLPKYKAFLAAYGDLAFSTKPGKYLKLRLPVLESSLNKLYDETA